MAGLFTEKFFPSSPEEFVGNVEIVDKTLAWAKNWEKGNRQKPLLFFGPPGIGKTCLVYVLSKHLGWDVFEVNASDYRSKDIIEKVVSAAALNSSFTGTKRLVLIDEVDGLQSRDRGGAGAINVILRETRQPVILTANNIYGERKLDTLKYGCELMQFKKINYLSIAKRLREICEKEGLAFEEEAVKLLAKNSGGDFRSALMDLQTLALGQKLTMESVESLAYRERAENIFSVLEKTFKATNFGEARKPRFRTDLDPQMLSNWVEENIPVHFTEPEDTASAFEKLSRADIFNGRIMRRQHWGFLRYSMDLMTAGVAMSRSQDYHGWIKYRFPGLLSRLSRSRGVRNLKKGLAGKIKEKTHSGSKKIISTDFPFLKQYFSDKVFAENFSARFGLNENEIAFLLDTKPNTKKVQSIFTEAQQIKKEFIAKKKNPSVFEQQAQEEEPETPAHPAEPDKGQTSLGGFVKK